MNEVKLTRRCTKLCGCCSQLAESQAREARLEKELKESWTAHKELLRGPLTIAQADAQYLRSQHNHLVGVIKDLSSALEGIDSALGDRLLASGPLSKAYAHAIQRSVSIALSSTREIRERIGAT